MRRVGIVGLCLGLAVASAGVIASAAQAGEVGRCVRLSSTAELYYGEYENSNCTAPATQQETLNGGAHNKWRWVPGPGPYPEYESRQLAAYKLVDGGTTVDCTKDSDQGHITGPATSEDTFTFSNCSLQHPRTPCENVGGTPGLIKTHVLETTVLDPGEHGLGGGTVGSGEVWIQYAPIAPDTVFVEFECGGSTYVQGTIYTVTGSVSGAVPHGGLNAMSFTFKLKFSPTSPGEQNLSETIFNPVTPIDETSPAELSGSEKSKYTERYETRT